MFRLSITSKKLIEHKKRIDLSLCVIMVIHINPIIIEIIFYVLRPSRMWIILSFHNFQSFAALSKIFFFFLFPLISVLLTIYWLSRLFVVSSLILIFNMICERQIL